MKTARKNHCSLCNVWAEKTVHDERDDLLCLVFDMDNPLVHMFDVANMVNISNMSAISKIAPMLPGDTSPVTSASDSRPTLTTIVLGLFYLASSKKKVLCHNLVIKAGEKMRKIDLQDIPSWDGWNLSKKEYNIYVNTIR